MGDSQCLNCQHYNGCIAYFDEETATLTAIGIDCEKGWYESNGNCPTYSPERHANNKSNTETRK